MLAILARLPIALQEIILPPTASDGQDVSGPGAEDAVHSRHPSQRIASLPAHHVRRGQVPPVIAHGEPRVLTALPDLDAAFGGGTTAHKAYLAPSSSLANQQLQDRHAAHEHASVREHVMVLSAAVGKV